MRGHSRGAGRLLSRFALLALVVGALVAGCGGEPRKPTPPATYTVRAGDTLYSIGWRHNLDYRDIARWNGIGSDYRIDVGQRLVLRPPQGGQVVRATPARSSPGTRATPSRPAGPLPAPPAWAWPVEGGSVGGQVRQPSGGVGLRIDGTLGQPVFAAADGKVVYTGSGLRGYGQLVIITHERGWLSAYGHNSAVLVEENAVVKRGQRIATMGLGPSQQPMLYFEVRHEGKPVDPLAQLPRR